MYKAVKSDRGFDVVIIVSSSREQADYWQRRIEATRGQVIGHRTRIISVQEDWPGGAGQLLGTLYAWQKAQSEQDLMTLIRNGGNVAMYHTAGKGTRMAPLPAAEANNKSAIKLPRLIEVDGEKTLLTVLEAVIFQTGIFAPTRPGRLCVFWGDQVFIPSELPDCALTHHAEILDIRAAIPSDAESWKRDWQSYGLIIPSKDGESLQREKQSWEQVQELIKGGGAPRDESGHVVMGKSLGSFSVSAEFVAALLAEFAPELDAKQGKMDTDPHLWMPLTSTREDFVSKGGDGMLWDRINRFKERFLSTADRSMKLFGDKNIGAGTLWWDYGQVRLYHENFRKALEDSHEGECLRKFYDLDRHRVRQSQTDDLSIEDSILVDATVKKGSVKDSVLVDVIADELHVSDSVILSSAIASIVGSTLLIYNTVNFTGKEFPPGTVLADVFTSSHGRVRMRTDLERDGKEDWESPLPGNAFSFEELNGLIGGQADPSPERSKWMALYRDRASVQRHLDRFRKGFIKPAIDNLVEIVWGGGHIEAFKGLPASGKRIGESWECSTHPRHPSTILLEDGRKVPLPDLVSLMGEDLLGTHVHREFKGQLPILFKFLDAREDLSVQVHPSDEKARELGEDDTGKNEAWLILGAEEGAVVYLGFKEDVDPAAFERDLSSPNVNIAERYLNAITVKPGDVLYNPTGAVHAIGKGVFLAEIQQSSGITYRVWDWNRVPKRELHIPQAMQSLNFRKTTRADYELKPRKLSESEERLIDSFYFTVDRITLAAGEAIDSETRGSFQILVCLEGDVELRASGESRHLSRGESLIVPASAGSYRIAGAENSVLLRCFVLQPAHIDPVIFQTYDVRAVADEYLSDRVCYYLGRGYGSYVRRLNDAPAGSLSVTVGGGVRLSTERIRAQVVKGILSTGVNVYDVGITSTPELYFSIPYLNADGGINMTASHNEAEYNGLKQVVRSEDGYITSINAAQMLEIKRTVLEGDFLDGAGQCVKVKDGEVVRYHNELVKGNCRLGRILWIEILKTWSDRGLKAMLEAVSALEFPESQDPEAWIRIRDALGLPPDCEQPPTAVKYPLAGLRVVIDFGNGSAWRTKSVYSDLGAEVVALNEEPDGSFPAHLPDPIKAKYRKQLEAAVLREAAASDKEVVGVGNDEDADRVIYVRSDGRAVEGDRTLCIQAKPIIEEHRALARPGKPRFMGEVKFARVAEEFITESGGEYIMTPTGFAFIKDGAKELSRAISGGRDEVELFGRTIDLRENREPIALAAELSGHQMSGHEENWIFDDSLLAAAKLLSVISRGVREGMTFIDIDEAVPRYPATPELNVRLGTNILAEKQEIVNKAVQVFQQKGYAIDTTDGGLIKWFDSHGAWLGQALVRKSNTQPMLICRVEARDEAAKVRIEDELFSKLSRVSTRAVPELDLASDDYIRGILPRVMKD